jgi:hypothetical protein
LVLIVFSRRSIFVVWPVVSGAPQARPDPVHQPSC